MSDLYGSADIETCHRKGHRLKTAWSDKTPMKVNVICDTCSEAQHKSVYVAYGVPEKSFGQWRVRRAESIPSQQEQQEAQHEQVQR
jgi:hypothetical protein